jgi:hypothetical protein
MTAACSNCLLSSLSWLVLSDNNKESLSLSVDAVESFVLPYALDQNTVPLTLLDFGRTTSEFIPILIWYFRFRRKRERKCDPTNKTLKGKKKNTQKRESFCNQNRW